MRTRLKEARVSDTFDVSPVKNEALRKCWLHFMRFQPFSIIYSNDPLSHYLYDWYFIRLLISVTALCPINLVVRFYIPGAPRFRLGLHQVRVRAASISLLHRWLPWG